MSVDDKQGRQALAYLNRITETAGSDPGAQLLRARALALSGRCAEAGAVLKKVAEPAGWGRPVYFSVGMAQAECKRYDAAEASFSRALDADPRNVEILYNLGLAALRADHASRAQSVLEIALKERPDDADALYALAQVCLKQQRPVEAAALLTRAEKAAPARADIILLIAQVAAQVEFYRGFRGRLRPVFETEAGGRCRPPGARFRSGAGQRFKERAARSGMVCRQAPARWLGLFRARGGADVRRSARRPCSRWIRRSGSTPHSTRRATPRCAEPSRGNPALP
jgi:tetratricopeptide (TPR) repeat protein